MAGFQVIFHGRFWVITEALEDFQERLDNGALDPMLGWVMAGVFRAVDELRDSEAANEGGVPFLVRALGEGQRDLAAEADRVMTCLGALYEGLFRLLEEKDVKVPSVVAELEKSDFSPTRYIYDASIPPEVRMVRLGRVPH